MSIHDSKPSTAQRATQKLYKELYQLQRLWMSIPSTDDVPVTSADLFFLRQIHAYPDELQAAVTQNYFDAQCVELTGKRPYITGVK